MKLKFVWKSVRNKERVHLYVGKINASLGSYDPIPEGIEDDEEMDNHDKYGRNEGFRAFCSLPGSLPTHLGGFNTELEAKEGLLKVVNNWFKSAGV